MLENVYEGLNVKNVYEGLNARSKVYLSKEYFCKRDPTRVSSKLCEFSPEFSSYPAISTFPTHGKNRLSLVASV